MTESDSAPGLEVGYARVSTLEQNPDMQRRALEAAGCTRVYEDRMSGTSPTRPEYVAMMKALRRGDRLTVWKLDRLGRSALMVLDAIKVLTDRGVIIRSLTEQIDGSTPGGRFMLVILAGLAQMERDLIAERTKAGLDAAKARGVKLGKADSLTPEKRAHADRLLEEGTMSKRKIADAVGVSRTRLYTHAAQRRKEKEGKL